MCCADAYKLRQEIALRRRATVSEAKTLIVPSKLVRRRFCFAYLARNPLHSDSRICSFTHEMALANANHRLLEEQSLIRQHWGITPRIPFTLQPRLYA
jgi:hypothetical protein